MNRRKYRKICELRDKYKNLPEKVKETKTPLTPNTHANFFENRAFILAKDIEIIEEAYNGLYNESLNSQNLIDIEQFEELNIENIRLQKENDELKREIIELKRKNKKDLFA